MVKSYLSYEPVNVFGVICSSNSNPSALVAKRAEENSNSHIIVSAAGENVILWDSKRGEMV